jgi:hypothetical protein
MNKKKSKILEVIKKICNQKKAQIQMMETMAILLIFFVLVVMGFVFFMKITSVTQGSKVTKDQELQSIRVSQAISFLPELQCSTKNIIDENCFDKYKLDSFESLDDEFYYPFFYFSKITVNETYPGDDGWVLYDRYLNGTSYKTTIPILLRNVTASTDSFGLLIVEYFPLG